MLTANNKAWQIQLEPKNERFWFEQNLMESFQELKAIGIDAGVFFDELASFTVHQNRIVLIAALLSQHNLKDFKKILKLLSKAARKELVNGLSDVCMAIIANFSKCRNKNLTLRKKSLVSKESFVLYIQGACSVWYFQDEILLKIYVFLIGPKKKFFCHNSAMISDRHHLSESLVHWCGSIKNKLSPAAAIFCPRVSTTFFAAGPTWLGESLSFLFQIEPCADARMLAALCWETNMAVLIPNLSHLVRVL